MKQPKFDLNYTVKSSKGNKFKDSRAQNITTPQSQPFSNIGDDEMAAIEEITTSRAMLEVDKLLPKFAGKPRHAPNQLPKMKVE